MNGPQRRNAARPGSEGGEGTNQLSYISTPGLSAQSYCAVITSKCGGTGRRPVQLRLFALDGALSEPYMAACAGNDAATSAAAVVGMTQ